MNPKQMNAKLKKIWHKGPQCLNGCLTMVASGIVHPYGQLGDFPVSHDEPFDDCLANGNDSI